MNTHPSQSLTELANEAYGSGVATQDAYYAGVEELARHLAGGTTSPRLQALLDATRFTLLVRNDPRREAHAALRAL